VLAYAQPPSKPGRLSGVDAAAIEQIHTKARFDVTLVKADGARSRLIKAPRDDEPRIPESCDSVIYVVSARAIGQPLSERVAHRVAQVAAVTGAKPGETITAEHILRLLSASNGALKDIGNARLVGLINMVDTVALEQAARQIASSVFKRTKRFDRIVLASMRRAAPLIGVITGR
jgi:probable selenium-dependent hydroxylase accessory protein YqeC